MVEEIPLESIEEIGREIGLNGGEIKRVKKYFERLKRNPKDIELHSIAQSWSEHACYKTSKPFLKKYFDFHTPQEMILGEDAGVLEFDEEHAYVVALESHNHPSAIEPYGGAATGIGGILRDVFCMGAQPIALVDSLFFGPFNSKPPKGVKHAHYIFSGVVCGIRDYGNRVGIPTVAGMIYFAKGYLGNPIINVGCVGICKKKNILRSRVSGEGEIFILCGGRTGRDGIHGVCFASKELGEDSEITSRQAVQIGDPILKEPLIHACLEATERGLISGMKDLGGGGLSCVVGEMAEAGGFGAEIYLEKVLLKEKDMKPWEIWVSESQERMMLSVKRENLKKVLEIFKKWDVEATPIGKVTKNKILRIYHNKELIYEIETNFLLHPQFQKKTYHEKKRDEIVPNLTEPKDYNLMILELLQSPNISSKENVIRQYDHEVRASTILKPLQGKIGFATHGDACVLKPLKNSFRGIAITSDANPSVSKINPFWGAAGAVDEACRNLLSVGAKPHSFADCLNFGNPEKRLEEFVETLKGLRFVAREVGVSFVSGNVSFYNESHAGVCPPTPTILGVGIAEDVRKCVSCDLKRKRNHLYLIGKTTYELGGSEYYRVRGVYGTKIPKVHPKVLKKGIDSLLLMMKKGLILSCHDVSNGGLAVTLAEMALGGNLGVEVFLGGRLDYELFSESNTRWVVEVSEEEKFLEHAYLKVKKIGEVKSSRFKINDCVDLSLKEIRDSWRGEID
ncbi:MAG: phosphoribosylformylglycinamidine synthase subunit PurL [Candidatus Methanofastidiosia archaeon]